MHTKHYNIVLQWNFYYTLSSRLQSGNELLKIFQEDRSEKL